MSNHYLFPKSARILLPPNLNGEIKIIRFEARNKAKFGYKNISFDCTQIHIDKLKNSHVIVYVGYTIKLLSLQETQISVKYHVNKILEMVLLAT